MFLYLVLLFTVIPMAELYILIKVGQHIGALNTLLIVIFTGVFGAYLAKIEGLRVFYNFQKDLQQGRMPTEKIMDGLLILIGAVLLITPGILTDLVGFLLIIPFTRALLKIWLKRHLQKIIDKRDGVITIKSYRED